MRGTRGISLLMAFCLLLGTAFAGVSEELELEIADDMAAIVDEAEKSEIGIDVPAIGIEVPEIGIEASEIEISAPDVLEEAAQIETVEVTEAANSAQIANDEDITLDETNFPDAGFRTFLSDKWDENGDGILSVQELEDKTSIVLGGYYVKSLKGIELFPKLEYLSCDNQRMPSLDLSGNPNLTYVSCYCNQLTTLDVSGHEKLTYLNCMSNNLKSINFSGCIGLREIVCSYNYSLATLDVTGLPSLERLSCNENRMKTLKVDNCPKLTSLGCVNNRLTSLNLSGDLALENVYCYANDLMTLDLSGLNAEMQAIFTEENLDMQFGSMTYRQGDRAFSCDNYVELTMNGRIIRPMNVKQISFAEKNGIILKPGATYQLNPIIVPANAKTKLTYYSMYDRVTISESGLIKAVKEGEDEVHLSTDNLRSADVYVLVTSVESIKVDSKKLTLGKGETYTPKVTLSPAGATADLTWFSNNMWVAKVDRTTGKIKAKMEGDAKITVSFGRGFSKTIKVHVADAPKSVTLYNGKAKLKKNQTLTLKKGKTMKLTAKLNGTSVSKKMTWKSSNKNVATVSESGKVVAKKQGTATISVTTFNKKTFKIKINVVN